ncbi:hypothetical protein G6F43_013277 [Rhizopus delemar]|nr:hypothetical protein G6F43_013277 [Rhizopus delemar]
MGWLPGHPPPCSCGPVNATRSHLLICLNVASRLQVSPGTRPNPLDYVLNQLPKVIPAYPLPHLLERWSVWWPAVCSILLDIDRICHPEGGFCDEAADTSGQLFLDKLKSPTSV